MTRHSILTALLLLFLIPITTAGQTITLDHFDGVIYDNILQVDTTVSFYFRYTTGSESIGGIVNGYRIYSPDGASWTTSEIDTVGELGGAMLDLGVFLFKWPGNGSDTVSCAGMVMVGEGIPAGFDDVSLAIRLGPLSEEDYGKRICIDSCFFRPSNRWIWINDNSEQITPAWGGPYCGIVAGSDTQPLDLDGDGVADYLDNCLSVANADQADIDNDGIGDACDNCTDTDLDGYGNPGYDNECPTDNCPDLANVDQADYDGDGIGDACDECTDTDGDGYGDPGFDNQCPEDNCPDIYNPDQADVDNDDIADVCDHCVDEDGDGYGYGSAYPVTCNRDNCPQVYNPDQADSDGDGVGDACDNCHDRDRDGFGDPGYEEDLCPEDNCPYIANPGQEDSNGDGIGDACCCELRGDADHDNQLSISDIVFWVEWAFNGGPAPQCLLELDINGDYSVDIADLVALISYMFQESTPPLPCP
ncbi:MAG TPA: thrombospondin type 3 repeat-containing protein [candidate division Zixibacteria bacterium]|nr:thrombospondin type 3 repeat-containing protein [candidate division Zixibacteria bacterium]